MLLSSHEWKNMIYVCVCVCFNMVSKEKKKKSEIWLQSNVPDL